MPILTIILLTGCVIGAGVLMVMAYVEKQAAPALDLKEKLKNLTQEAQNNLMGELGEINKPKAKASFDYRKFFATLTGQAYVEKLDRDLAQSDIPMKVGEFLMFRVLLVLIGFGLAQLLTRNPAIALATAGVMAFIHIPIMKLKRSMRINKFVSQLAEFLILITNSLRAGQTFLQGVDIAANESPAPIGAEFKQLLKETNLGIPVDQAFDNMLLRIPSEDLKIVMSAFSIQRQVGGNLADIMDQVAAMIRQRIQIQGQIKVLTTQGKLSGAIVGLLPVGLGTIITMINYKYMARLWTVTPESGWSGPIMLAIGIFMELLGCFVIYKICDIEV